MYPRSIYLDVEILAEVIQRVENGLHGAWTSMDAERRAMVVAILYERMIRADGMLDEKRINAFVKCIAP